MSHSDYGYSSSGRTGTPEAVYRAVERLLSEYVDKDASLLEIGCGNGYFARRLADAGYDVRGVDTSASGIAFAVGAHPHIAFSCETAGLLQRSLSSAFDAVVSVEVIEHCASTGDFCNELASCLKPGGTAIVTTPYHGYLKNLLIALAGRFDRHFNPLWDGGHIKFFSPATITQALSCAGLRVMSIANVGRVPALAKSMVVHAVKPR